MISALNPGGRVRSSERCGRVAGAAARQKSSTVTSVAVSDACGILIPRTPQDSLEACRFSTRRAVCGECLQTDCSGEFRVNHACGFGSTIGNSARKLPP
jgi:hypothetical protein